MAGFKVDDHEDDADEARYNVGSTSFQISKMARCT